MCPPQIAVAFVDASTEIPRRLFDMSASTQYRRLQLVDATDETSLLSAADNLK